MYNKLEDNFHLSNKKALFINMKNYYASLNQEFSDGLPLTFHIKTGIDDPEYQHFKDLYLHLQTEGKSNDNIWIIKPGENTNRG
jgi:tubulin--tyrosine ligase